MQCKFTRSVLLVAVEACRPDIRYVEHFQVPRSVTDERDLWWPGSAIWERATTYGLFLTGVM